MSYHDRHLLGAIGRDRSRTYSRRMKALLRGVNQITLRPAAPSIRFGSLHGDMQKIGADMRGAMRHLDRCE